MTRSDFELPALWRYPSARHNPSALMHRVTLQVRLPLCKEDLHFYTHMPQESPRSIQVPKMLKWKHAESQSVNRHGKFLPLLTLRNLQRGESNDPEYTVAKAGWKKGTELRPLANK